MGVADFCTFVLGSVNVDIRLGVERIVTSGETLLASNLGSGIGGKGANQASAIAALGNYVKLISAVGNDLDASHALNYLEERGVDISNIARIPGPTGRAYIQIKNSGENAIVVCPNAGTALNTQFVLNRLQSAKPNDVLVAQLETPIAVVQKAFDLAHAKEMYTILNPSPAQHLPEAILRNTDLIVVNEVEGAFYARSTPSLAGSQETLRRIAHLGPRSVVQTLGSRGAAYLDPQGNFGIADSVPVDVVDTTGAGDAFLGALVAPLQKGADLAEACSYANKVASYCVTQTGPLQKIPESLH
uniref:ribokinase n=1 Tax=Vaginimicrobium propionicum TaxID=1871034 RepID=UPI0009704C0D|nr:ribokinase [Vaginimicrobium propionicum]